MFAPQKLNILTSVAHVAVSHHLDHEGAGTTSPGQVVGAREFLFLSPPLYRRDPREVNPVTASRQKVWGKARRARSKSAPTRFQRLLPSAALPVARFRLTLPLALHSEPFPNEGLAVYADDTPDVRWCGESLARGTSRRAPRTPAPRTYNFAPHLQFWGDLAYAPKKIGLVF